jgi:NhaP-type Na+/H+ or K+/H+ antiporter
MEFFLIVLLLLATIGLSNFVNHFMPFIPVPLIQIALGVSLAAIPLGIHIQLEPDLFFVLFIAPLLFNDGRNVSRAALWKLRKQILLLALGLVFVTVFVMGYIIHWLIPSIPLPAAFALAAILSPTDVVAVSALSSRVNMPKNIMHLLEGEGLINDASGLVAFKFAVAATVTGAFSLADASWSFLVIALGGMVGGAFLAFIIIRIRVFIRRLGMEV